MPAPGISFNPPYDLHLVRGQSVILKDILLIGGQSVTTYLAANPSITLVFSANFKGGPLPGGWYSGLGIGIITDSVLGGIVQTDRPGPADDIKNFHLTATVTHTDGSTNVAKIRIHIHSSIKQAWLSPQILTVQKGINGFRCSVRARFDDDVEAEIGPKINIRNGRVIDYHYGTSILNIVWSSPTANLINSVSGEITPGAAIATGLHSVSAVISCTGINLAQGGGPTVTASGQIFVADQLSGTRTDITASLVTTGNCPGFAKINDVPNVLFIPDGFHAENSGVFDLMVDKYVSDLTTGKISSPFDILNGSMNYWKVFLTSGDEGATNSGERALIEISGHVKAQIISEGKKPAEDFLAPSNWTYKEILYKIGMPVRTDVSKSHIAIRTDWKSKTNLTSGDIDSIPNSAVDNWKALGERRLPEERDTVLGILIDDYIAVSNDGNYGMVRINPRRMSRLNLDHFLATLKDDRGNLIGDKFIMSPPRGKDYDRIVYLSSAFNGRENNFDGGFFIVVNTEQFYFPVSGSISSFKVLYDFDNNDLGELPLAQKAVLTHELGHSFGLEDEYGETSSDVTLNNKFVNDGAVSGLPYTLFTGAPSLVDWSGNVQSKPDLLSTTDAVTKIDANKIKWRYHRIKKCGVVKLNPVQNGARTTITLNPGQATVFALDDKVFLRKRRKHKSVFFLYKLPDQIIRAEVVSTNPAGPLTISEITLTLTAINAAANEITVSSGGAFNNIIVVPGQTTLFAVGETAVLWEKFLDDPIAISTRSPSATPLTVSDTINLLVSPELVVRSVNGGADTVEIEVVAGGNLTADFMSFAADESMILYNPVTAPAAWGPQFKFAELISQKVIDHILIDANAFPFNAKPDPAHGNAITEIVDYNRIQNSSIPSALVPCCSSRKKEIVALYSGGNQYHSNIYHPTAHCFMRIQREENTLDEFCAVCKYILINMIDPTKHGMLDEQYAGRKIYPE